jgi:hypothetical protein
MSSENQQQVAGAETAPTPTSPKEIEQEQETKLKAKYPGVRRGGSSLLQKRLTKGQKYFDSGDYNMAKAKMGTSSRAVPTGQKLLLPEGGVVGDEIPTPESVPRKTNVHSQSKLASEMPS